jgi:hypothetical protein
MNISYGDKLEAIKECLIDYSGPIFLSGSVFDMHTKSLTVLEADVPKEELLIINNKFPEWLVRLKNNSDKGNVLLIKNFDKISLEDQRRFVEIICNNCICSEALPENLRIIINSTNKCELIPEIEEVIQYFEI